MLLKTRCIVLKQIDYSDSSVIVHTYTREAGRLAFIARVSRSKTTKIKRNLFQPLFLLEIESQIKDNRSLQTISELRLNPVLNSVHFHPHKNAVALFLSEILYLCLKEESPSYELYDFLENSICYFDIQSENINSFHPFFLIKLLKFLGFYPAIPKPGDYFLDIKTGHFTKTKPLSNIYMSFEETSAFIKCMKLTYMEMPDLNKVRRNLLDKILMYYSIHLLNEKPIKSYKVLKDVFE